MGLPVGYGATCRILSDAADARDGATGDSSNDWPSRLT